MLLIKILNTHISKCIKTNTLIFSPKTNHTVKNGFFICITEFLTQAVVS
jgi:hypothetical protein